MGLCSLLAHKIHFEIKVPFLKSHISCAKVQIKLFFSQIGTFVKLDRMNLNGIVHWCPVQIYYSLPFCGYFEKTTEYSLSLPENEKESYHYR